MIQDAVTQLGPWSWFVLGFLLLAAEVVAPGVFLIWIGMAALIVGALSLALWDHAVWGWQLQWVLFAVLSGVTVLVGRRVLGRSNQITDEPNLNQRGQSLVGRTAILAEPIAEGRGRIRLDDTTWSVTGPDLPVGARVRVASSAGRELVVVAVA